MDVVSCIHPAGDPSEFEWSTLLWNIMKKKMCPNKMALHFAIFEWKLEIAKFTWFRHIIKTPTHSQHTVKIVRKKTLYCSLFTIDIQRSRMKSPLYWVCGQTMLKHQTNNEQHCGPKRIFSILNWNKWTKYNVYVCVCVSIKTSLARSIYHMIIFRSFL